MTFNMRKYEYIWEIADRSFKTEPKKKKMYSRAISARTRWKKNYNIPEETIDNLIKKYIEKKCQYCEDIIGLDNMALDHKTPISLDGNSSLNNLHIVCKRCNQRKGMLSHKSYKDLLKLISGWQYKEKKYLLTQLTMQVWSKWN